MWFPVPGTGQIPLHSKKEEVSVAVIDNEGLAKNDILVGDVINSITIDGVEYTVDKVHVVIDSMLNARVGSTVILNVTRGSETFDVKIVINEKSLTQIK